VVNTTSGNGNKQSPVFDVRGTSFRVTTELEATSDPGLLFFSIDVNKEGGDNVTTIDRESPGTDTSIVNEGPGSFFLDILAANVKYTITVEDCTGSSGGGGGGTPPPTDGVQDNPSGGNTHENATPAEDQYTSKKVPPGAINKPTGVKLKSVVGKKVPNTGGPPYLAVGALALLGTALIVGRGVLRR